MRFELRRADTLTLDVVGPGNEPVRSLAERRRYDRGPVEFAWDGRDESGRVVRDGVYRPRLNLASGARTFVLPNRIRVDTGPPRVESVEVAPRAFSPDGDGRNDKIAVEYEVDEPAHGLLFVRGRRVVRTFRQPLEGRMEWFGRRDGRSLRAGAYRLEVAAEDRAGNVGPRRDAGRVAIRYIELARTTIRALAQTRFGVRVRTDASSFRWRFAGRTGRARPGLLVLRARRPGRFALYVETNGRAARARVAVRRR